MTSVSYMTPMMAGKFLQIKAVQLPSALRQGIRMKIQNFAAANGLKKMHGPELEQRERRRRLTSRREGIWRQPKANSSGMCDSLDKPCHFVSCVSALVILACIKGFCKWDFWFVVRDWFACYSNAMHSASKLAYLQNAADSAHRAVHNAPTHVRSNANSSYLCFVMAIFAATLSLRRGRRIDIELFIETSLTNLGLPASYFKSMQIQRFDTIWPLLAERANVSNDVVAYSLKEKMQ